MRKKNRNQESKYFVAPQGQVRQYEHAYDGDQSPFKGSPYENIKNQNA
jgi:hypothetical protein